MTRLAVSAAMLLTAWSTPAQAQETVEPEIGTAVACLRDIGCTEDPRLLDGLVDIAAEADVSPSDLLGALNSLAAAGIPTNARAYLSYERAASERDAESSSARAVGQAGGDSHPAGTGVCGWPICGALGQRIYCIEGIESHHGAAMYNPTPVWNGEHAQGFLGFLPSTARTWGVAIGNRASEWAGASHMIAAGQGRQFYGIAAGRC